MSTTDTGGMGRLLPERLQQSYLAKMVVIFVAILLVVSAVGGYQYVQESEHVRHDAEQALIEAANENSNYLTAWADTHTEAAAVLSNSGELASDDQMGAYLASQHAMLGDDVVDLSVVDLQSLQVLASTTDGTVGTAMTDIQMQGAPPTFEDPSAVTLSQGYSWQGASDTSVISFVSPVQQDATRALVLTVDTASINALMTQDGMVTQLLMPGGIVGFDSSGEYTYQPYPGSDSEIVEIIAAAEPGASGVVEQAAIPGLMDERHLVAYTSYGNGMGVIVHQPTSTAYAMADEFLKTIEYLLLAAVLGFVALGVILSRTTVKPLRALDEKVTALREGDLDVDLRTGRSDEFGSVLGGVAALLHHQAADQLADAAAQQPLLVEGRGFDDQPQLDGVGQGVLLDHQPEVVVEDLAADGLRQQAGLQGEQRAEQKTATRGDHTGT